MFKIAIVDKMHEDGINLLKKNPKFQCEIIEDLSKENLISKLPNFDGMTLRRGKIDAEILEKCKNLKVISRHGVGYDNVDINFLKKNNIKLLVTATTTSISPAEHIMFMILNISKGIDFFDKSVRQGEFGSVMHIKHNTFELSNKKILIIGFGRIGRQLIKRCLGFEMKVHAYDPFVDKKTIESFGGKKVDELNIGLQEADIISLSVPLTKETHNMINMDKMKMMKKNAVIINTSRGGIVNEKDLNEALNKNIIYGAGLDVFEKEPPENNNPLLSNKKVVLSPHAATFTKECLSKMSMETTQNIINFFENKLDKLKIVKL
jgi:D-3-phosphoglycerate dehydrogenase|tara:strand:- start:734 stop:1693 length:960 start_codon:yes stop_codon:yes gene_type:complete